MRALWVLFVLAIAYQLLANLAALRHVLNRRRPHSNFLPAVSILKPLRGVDPNSYEAFVSQVEQRYPMFEILFGARDGADPAVRLVRRLQREHPDAAIHLVIGGESTPNAKVGVLIELARHARYPVWVVNDSDIKVNSEYLSQIVAPLSDLSAGIVTCLYRVKAHTLAAAWEALGIATDFMPSTLVAQLLGVREFGLGSTLAFRAEDLQHAGGFEALANYIADDYQLAKRITTLGKRAILSRYTVETSLGEATWPGIWRHQIRWARTIRASKGRAYMGLPITHAGLWTVIALAVGAWIPAALLLLFRIASAMASGGLVLRDSVAVAFCWLSPAWDLYAFCVWLASFVGRTVRWRDQILTIDSRGRIET